MATNPKIWLDFNEQLKLLQSRGLQVDDEQKAKEYLSRIGYYRLSGYFYSLREITGELVILENYKKPKKVKTDKLILDTFKEGACFKDAVDLYVFDKQLRLLVMDVLERIEVALRTDIAHTLGSLDKFAYLKPECLHESFAALENLDSQKGITKHQAWLAKHAALITRSKEDFIYHNKTKYGLPIPIWVVCEIWDFGTMSTLFSGMRMREQDEISQKYGVSNGRIFASWLRSLNYLRNVCAHHCRLWNRSIKDQPRLPDVNDSPPVWMGAFPKKENQEQAKARCFLLLFICKHLLSIINPSSSWCERMKEHLLTFPELNHLGLNLQGMGAPTDWQNWWNKKLPSSHTVK
ncbi:abortive phage resistance protein [Neisseria dentiae]|uniref:Abortive phage resistance protein n=1 Tax=Neisseria dentiae TaxID=194197 RepID=A0A1X3D930_9NEIS|nr:Abi family protein [Neisseria dentiae]OSI16222.1 abortive phage resistance protein [Neisseria dentiae]QMT44582.1 Abi family protein [Neisseria dentiae]STZ50286.1 putative abortive infection bacteriophage resistance protein [Neisseria dentiae]